jgi:hypothetical protein
VSCGSRESYEESDNYEFPLVTNRAANITSSRNSTSLSRNCPGKTINRVEGARARARGFFPFSSFFLCFFFFLSAAIETEEEEEEEEEEDKAGAWEIVTAQLNARKAVIGARGRNAPLFRYG